MTQKQYTAISLNQSILYLQNNINKYMDYPPKKKTEQNLGEDFVLIEFGEVVAFINEWV